jgi:hypothetical protein
MKKHLVIILALLFALSSCDSDLRRAKRYYQQAQNVAVSDLDSALILIDSVLNIMVFLDDDAAMVCFKDAVKYSELAADSLAFG